MTTYEETCARLLEREQYYLKLDPKGTGANTLGERYRRMARTAELLRRKIEGVEGAHNGLVYITLFKKDESFIGAHGSTLETNIRLLGKEVGVRFSHSS